MDLAILLTFDTYVSVDTEPFSARTPVGGESLLKDWLDIALRRAWLVPPGTCRDQYCLSFKYSACFPGALASAHLRLQKYVCDPSWELSLYIR